MSFAHRVGGSSLALAAMQRTAARPAGPGLSGGSAIRFGIDPSHPGGSGQAGQRTAAVAAEETATSHPTPKPGPAAPKPVVVTMAELSGRNPRPAGADAPAGRMVSLLPAPEPARGGLLAALRGWLGGLFGSAGR
jgi:hypothetical protein